jgi:hypothetical protein
MRVARIGLLPVLIFVSITFGQRSEESRSRDYKLSVDVDLVIFNVTVTDAKGHPVKGLSKSDFRIIEGGQDQDLEFVRPEDTPATVGLVIDNSGSMRRKRSDVINAGTAFVEASNPHDEIFVVNFNERISMGLPPGMAFTSDLSKNRTHDGNFRNVKVIATGKDGKPLQVRARKGYIAPSGDSVK